MFNLDEAALNIINEWKKQTYKAESQQFARLQLLISEGIAEANLALLDRVDIICAANLQTDSEYKMLSTKFNNLKAQILK